jgi:hypothetical protein
LKQAKVDATKILEQRNSLNERNMTLDRELTTIEQLVKSLEGDMKQQLEKIKQDPDNELSSSDISEQTSQVQDFFTHKCCPAIQKILCWHQNSICNAFFN